MQTADESGIYISTLVSLLDNTNSFFIDEIGKESWYYNRRLNGVHLVTLVAVSSWPTKYWF